MVSANIGTIRGWRIGALWKRRDRMYVINLSLVRAAGCAGPVGTVSFASPWRVGSFAPGPRSIRSNRVTFTSEAWSRQPPPSCRTRSSIHRASPSGLSRGEMALNPVRGDE